MSQTKIKLNDGTEVPIDEFITWDARKQSFLLKNYREILAGKYKNGVYRKVITPKGEFINTSKAADAEGVSVSVLTRKLRHVLYPDYHYVDETPEDLIYTKPIRKRMSNPEKYNSEREKLLGKKTKTPLGIFDTLGKAAKAHGVTMPTIKRRMRDFPEEFYFVDLSEVSTKND
jgi:hypothetical protein